jgi:hypothetical protein
MQAVENFTAAMTEDAAASDSQESPSRCVVIQDGHISIHQKNVGRNGVKELPQQDLIAHLCYRNAHGLILASARAACQHKSRMLKSREARFLNRASHPEPRQS